MARLPSLFDGSSSVFVGSLPKKLAVVAVGPWVGRRYGDVITSIITSDWHPRQLAWGKRVRRGCSTSGPSTAGMRWLEGVSARGPRWLRLIFVGNADEAPYGGSPLVELFHSRRKVEKQLRTCQSFCWHGRWQKLRGP